MALDLNDKKYIHYAVDKSLRASEKRMDKKWDERMTFHLAAFRDGIRDEIKMLAELIGDRPTRDEMQRGFDELREEIREIKAAASLHGIL